ncbi:MAG: phospholipid carrier-dependent glycosyltransferase, partial [Candidatus Woesearchaeota archaeon]|nr:phospholipid carrier-dependent glycosyltransferase [Candidatus Woesearchaeota archaeon]
MNAARKLALIYLILVGLKIIGSFFIVTPTVYNDEYIYAKTARSIAASFSYTIHEIPANQYMPLYPLILSTAYLFQDMNNVYLIIKIINALLATLIIIPAYLFAKEFVSTRESANIATLIAVLPPTFAFTSYIMAENLFYPIFLTALYLIYKAQQEKTIKYNIFAGIAIGAAILTRFIGVTLVGIVVLLFLRSLFTKQYEEIKKKSILGIVTVA